MLKKIVSTKKELIYNRITNIINRILRESSQFNFNPEIDLEPQKVSIVNFYMTFNFKTQQLALGTASDQDAIKIALDYQLTVLEYPSFEGLQLRGTQVGTGKQIVVGRYWAAHPLAGMEFAPDSELVWHIINNNNYPLGTDPYGDPYVTIINGSPCTQEEVDHRERMQKISEEAGY